MPYKNEKSMYSDVIKWFRKILASKFPNSSISVHDTSNVVLSKFLLDNGLHKYFPNYQTFEIEVDITGIVRSRYGANLGFVECKLNKISLRDVSQLLGYSKVAQPVFSLIISPAGFSDSINFLFNVHRRDDILYYEKNRLIYIAKWLESRQDIDYASLLPKGSQLT
jgi:hypothetical protein